MSKALKIYKIISNVLLLICSAFFAYITISSVHTMLTEEMGGLAILITISIMAYGVPAILYAIIYNIVMGIKKKYTFFDGITLAIFLICYASLLVAPIIVNAVIN